jgi:general L-amino acid transport system substrate-binding protein
MRIHVLVAFVISLPLLVSTVVADTLSETRERGAVRCGVNPDLKGFSHQNSLGEFSGFDVDFCRAISAAIFSDPDRVEYTPVSAPDRLIALRDGRIDVLSRNTTFTLGRDVEFGEYVGIYFYDGQGFMTKKASGIRSALELDNQKICVSRGTTTELNASDFFADSELRYQPVFFEDEIDAAIAYEKGNCVALTTDRSALAAQRASFDSPEAHLVLPEVISKEPLGPVVRHGDQAWEQIARWTLNCLINAEELRITQDSVERLSSPDSPPAIRRVLGVEGTAGEELGLELTWCASIIKNLGNYKEIYDRHIGIETPVGLDRGINELWTNSGLLYAPQSDERIPIEG